MKTPYLIFLTLSYATACSASTPAWDVQSVAVANVPFREYRTFTFGLPEAPPSDYELRPSSLTAEPEVQRFLAEAIEHRGYVEDGDHPQLIVRFSLGISRNSAVDPEAATYESTQERVACDVYDAATKTQVWHGSTSVSVGRHSVRDDVLRQAVWAMVSELPESARAGHTSSGTSSAHSS
jgi:hypothetical protein